jgi:hypothetical protein
MPSGNLYNVILNMTPAYVALPHRHLSNNHFNISAKPVGGLRV